MRVGILGLGAVGEACAHALAGRAAVSSLVLANRSVDTAMAVRMDLEQSRSWGPALTARAVLPWRRDAFRGCDVLLLTAGPRLRGAESRPDKAAAAASLLLGVPGASVVDALSTLASNSGGDGRQCEAPPVLVVVTNPVEASVTWLAERVGWPRSRIMGLGTTVESARFTRLLADRLNVDPASVWTEIIGEHGKDIAVRDPDALRRRVEQLDCHVDVDDLLERTRNAASDIRAHSEKSGREAARRLLDRLRGERGSGALSEQCGTWLEEELAYALAPPATRFAIAAAVVEVVNAVGTDRGRILPVSGFTDLSGVSDVALAAPFVVGRSGLLATALTQAPPILMSAAATVREQVRAMRSASRHRA